MKNTFKEQTVVKDGGAIEIQNPHLPKGALAEVTIVLSSVNESNSSSPLSQFFGKVKNGFTSAEEADAFIRSERDSWDMIFRGYGQRQVISYPMLFT